MIIGLKSFQVLKRCCLPLELVYCLIVCFYISNVSNDSSLYIVKKNIKNFGKEVIIYSKKISKTVSLKKFWQFRMISSNFM